MRVAPLSLVVSIFFAIPSAAQQTAAALEDIGQASHTAQDIVRHNFETASQHGWSEPAATDSEARAAMQATSSLLDQVISQMYSEGLRDGLSFTQITKLVQDLLNGQDKSASNDLWTPSPSSVGQCPPPACKQ